MDSLRITLYNAYIEGKENDDYVSIYRKHRKN